MSNSKKANDCVEKSEETSSDILSKFKEKIEERNSLLNAEDFMFWTNLEDDGELPKCPNPIHTKQHKQLEKNSKHMKQLVQAIEVEKNLSGSIQNYNYIIKFVIFNFVF